MHPKSNNHDVNGDGVKDEKDAYDKSVTIFGKLLERGLNTVNMPWCDNSSRWSMGLVKRVDYNGRVKQLKPDWVVPANDGGLEGWDNNPQNKFKRFER